MHKLNNSTSNLRFSLTLLLLVGTATSCTITATRPIQEMHNADVAIKAAKDLSADSLAPDIFRASVDAYFKAKREYRLKNFDNARKYALNAAKLAEQSEFIAYQKGGANPELNASGGLDAEGSYADPDSAFNNQGFGNLQPPPPKPSRPPNPSSQAKSEDSDQGGGVDYNEYMRQKEAEAEAAKQKAKEPAKKDESGPTGPKNVVTKTQPRDVTSSHPHPEAQVYPPRDDIPFMKPMPELQFNDESTGATGMLSARDIYSGNAEIKDEIAPSPELPMKPFATTFTELPSIEGPKDEK